MPHIASLLCDTVEEVVAASDVVVIGNGAAEFAKVMDLAHDDHIVIDLVRIAEPSGSQYEGIGW